MKLCTNKDDKFLKEKTIWIAELSDGSKVYQDDGRKGEQISSAWLRLQKHVVENNLHIDKISINFRSHTETVPQAEYYHFSKAIGCVVGQSQQQYFIFGTINNGKIKRRWYRIPEIMVTEKRVEQDLDKYKQHFIKGKKNG